MPPPDPAPAPSTVAAPSAPAAVPASRRPGEPALGALGLAAPEPDPADSSPHAFPDGGRWRTEVPSVEGPEALAAVLKESARLDVPLHRVSQGSGVWMLTDAEITEMTEASAERDIELCLFTGPRGTWDTGASARTDSRGGGLRARGHDALMRLCRGRAARHGTGSALPPRRRRGRAVDAAQGARRRRSSPPTPRSRSPRWSGPSTPPRTPSTSGSAPTR